MTRNVRLGEFILGVQGLAILRNLLVGDDETVHARLAEIRDLLERFDEPPAGLAVEVSEFGLGEGYAAWSRSFDRIRNPLHEVEEPALLDLLRQSAPGLVLDAACGTGRWADKLAALGHTVVGVDASPEMLAVARDKLPAPRLARGDMGSLPLAGDRFDLVVCANALTHCPELDGPVAELARVTRRGGRLLLCDPHPVTVILGGHPLVRASDGRFGYVRDRPHLHGAYLRAFARTGLVIRDCVEVAYGPDALTALELLSSVPEAREAAYSGIPASLIWDVVKPG